jgi:hypothetical protein
MDSERIHEDGYRATNLTDDAAVDVDLSGPAGATASPNAAFAGNAVLTGWTSATGDRTTLRTDLANGRRKVIPTGDLVPGGRWRPRRPWRLVADLRLARLRTARAVHPRRREATGEGIDVRADVHALGAVAYQMLTGRLIREGGIASLMDARLPHAPSTISTLPRSMDSVLLRAIHPSREERWPDVGSFTRALRASLTSQEAAPEASREGSRWLLVLLCLLVLAGTFAAPYAVTNQLR